MSEERLQLKNQALLERVSQIVAQYEDRVAELRVDLTLLSNELEELKKADSVSEETAKSPDKSN
jgi:uncharacterized coiled-coil protein SlyX